MWMVVGDEDKYERDKADPIRFRRLQATSDAGDAGEVGAYTPWPWPPRHGTRFAACSSVHLRPLLLSSTTTFSHGRRTTDDPQG